MPRQKIILYVMVGSNEQDLNIVLRRRNIYPVQTHVLKIELSMGDNMTISPKHPLNSTSLARIFKGHSDDLRDSYCIGVVKSKCPLKISVPGCWVGLVSTWENVSYMWRSHNKPFLQGFIKANLPKLLDNLHLWLLKLNKVFRLEKLCYT